MANAAACDLGKPNSENPTTLSNTSLADLLGHAVPDRAVAEPLPVPLQRLAAAPRLIARRSDSASPVVKPAIAIATSST